MPTTETSPPTGPERYLSRELSELAFQRRVLHEATDDRNPLLERVKFLAILTQNLDEFFQKRVGQLELQVAAGVTERSADGRTPEAELDEAIERATALCERQAACYRDLVDGPLAEAGIEIAAYDDLDSAARADLRERFESDVLPILTPLTFDPAHPFPHISNLSLSIAVSTRDDAGEDDLTFSRVKVPGNRPRLLNVEGGTFVPIEGVIRHNLDLLFPNTEIVDHSVFRVTRNAEVAAGADDPDDLTSRVETLLRERRFARVVRLDVEAGTPERVVDLLQDQLGVGERETFRLDGLLDYRGLMALTDLDRPGLKLDSWEPREHPRLPDTRECDVFETIREKDVLVHHPYHSFRKTVQRFLREAARDPDVLAIKAAIYRTARDSEVVEALIEAARNGKQVAVMVELTARFDEENNLRWADRLEEEGIHVAYGTIGYKTHTKTALVVREEDEGVQLYSHVATGNYHAETAERYEDLGLLTADREIGDDLVRLFNYFTGHSLHERYEELLIAPTTMRERFVELIRREAAHAERGEDARITAKMNRLEDPDVIDELYAASQAGVEIDLLVRDVCRLRPGVEGLSETISVRSVVGRFLEHSRIYRFENAAARAEPKAAGDGGGDDVTGGGNGETGGDDVTSDGGGRDEDSRAYYIGSADWMTRNLDERVEAVAPVHDPDLRATLDDVLATLFADNRKAWVMSGDGTYALEHPADGDPVVNAQETLMARAAERAPSRAADSEEPTRRLTPEELSEAVVSGARTEDDD
ncbi:polyphosphate kinase [Halarchaeum rubridurum]|uniref:Polyphosphate kinase n=1 Tax=Halarchaeum rubridurum TaxID=489911 RepID=A0A830FX18_9EURY|nr:polyphosphate kinase 1 [Halarchaeum rubridurum]MBP1953992.1 polyphosphate kinase [Halarchaeum rubridurum]GGM56476.1 polyphosphate kinase [Halarchaeum rubridurum]